MTQTVDSSKEDVVDYIFDRVGFNPTPAQMPILFSRKRFILVAGGEQAG
jgi:hypothetical protein